KIGGDAYVLPSFALTNGDGANILGADHGGLKAGGRLDFLPFGKFNSHGQYRGPDMAYELTPKLVFGATYSYNSGMSDRRGRQSGQVLYRDSLGKEALPDYAKFGADFLFKFRGFTMLGEYVNANAIVPATITQRVRNDGTVSTAFLVNGVQNVSDYVKGRIITGSAVNVQAGYLFSSGISVDGRFTRMMPATNSFLTNGTFYNRSKYYTVCVGKYLSRNYGAKLQASFTYTKAEPGTLSVLGTTITGNELSGALQLTIAL
ncbi:MAG: porin, partial [Bacteroidota bacterium]